jgi:hypothetical protein
MRAFHLAALVVFLFGATLQYNDPDPIRWMAIYLAAATVMGFALARHRQTRLLAVVVGAVALVWALTYLPAVLRHGQVLSMFDEWKMRNEEVLQNREMFGLLIIAGAMALTAWRAPKRRH